MQGCDPQTAAEFLRALAHPMRLQILCRLLDGELSVAGFESELGLKQPNLSQQLGQLREAALVTTRREAKSIIYSLSDERVHGLLEALHRVMGAAGAARRQPVAPPAARPTVRAPRASRAAVAPPAPAGCGLFSVAGWPGASKPGTDTRG